MKYTRLLLALTAGSLIAARADEVHCDALEATVTVFASLDAVWKSALAVAERDEGALELLHRRLTAGADQLGRVAATLPAADAHQAFRDCRELLTRAAATLVQEKGEVAASVRISRAGDELFRPLIRAAVVLSKALLAEDETAPRITKDERRDLTNRLQRQFEQSGVKAKPLTPFMIPVMALSKSVEILEHRDFPNGRLT